MNMNMKKIMIVDDDLSILDALKVAVELKGYSVTTLSTGEGVDERMREVKPDLLLLDVLLSGLDGRDIAYGIKKDPVLREIPIIMLSASPSTDRSARDFGADDFIAKPFELDQLYSAIEKQLS
jgi:CheY-like chemotaxis protein